MLRTIMAEEDALRHVQSVRDPEPRSEDLRIFLLEKKSGWWFGTFFPHIGDVIIPIDFHIFQRGRYTTNQKWEMVII